MPRPKKKIEPPDLSDSPTEQDFFDALAQPYHALFQPRSINNQ